MLAQYQTQTSQLLQNPAAPTTLYPTAVLTQFINTARGQLAGVEGKCIRAFGTLQLVVGQRTYPFSSINLGTQVTTGIAGVIVVNQAFYSVGVGGLTWFPPRPWEWFLQYHLSNAAPLTGVPAVWAQYGQGAAPPAASSGSGAGAGGTIYIDPLPNFAYTLQVECTCFPQALALDTDVEAIPYLWTDAVPYFAAYLALLSAQTSARMAEALRYKELYTEFCARARDAANSTELPYIYQGGADVVKMNQQQMGAGRAA